MKNKKYTFSNSAREFLVIVLESQEPYYNTIELDMLFSNNDQGEYEYIYALQEIIDSILDLRYGESLYFQPNRDDDSTKGIIRRIK